MDFNQARFNMVEQQIRPGCVLDFDVLDALSEIPREKFVSSSLQGLAYADVELPLENGGVMLSPLTVARMAQALALKPTDKVLEIGTGSGYATALLARLSQSVVTVDIDEAQQERAKNALIQQGNKNISYVIGDGFVDAKEHAPFDAIYVGGGCASLPDTIKEQLAPNGRLIVIEGAESIMSVKLYTAKEGVLSWKSLFETETRLLNNDTSKSVFKF